MSKKVIITSDSTLDLTPELLDRFGIAVIPLTILLGKESFPRQPRVYSRDDV